MILSTSTPTSRQPGGAPLFSRVRFQPYPLLPIFRSPYLPSAVCFPFNSLFAVDCPVIFTRAYDEYAIRAFKVNSIRSFLTRSRRRRSRQPRQGDRIPAVAGEVISMIAGMGKKDEGDAGGDGAWRGKVGQEGLAGIRVGAGGLEGRRVSRRLPQKRTQTCPVWVSQIF